MMDKLESVMLFLGNLLEILAGIVVVIIVLTTIFVAGTVLLGSTEVIDLGFKVYDFSDVRDIERLYIALLLVVILMRMSVGEKS